MCEQELEKLGNRIQRLGPINLAAIDEYAQQSERKVYLDKQNADLERALDTLENAIRKIDKETRSRFKDTFRQDQRWPAESVSKSFWWRPRLSGYDWRRFAGYRCCYYGETAG